MVSYCSHNSQRGGTLENSGEMIGWELRELRLRVTKISDPAHCSCSGGARGVGGLTYGLELELELSDRIGVKKWRISDRASALENKSRLF
jgi:hypothetical protein